MIKEKKKIKSNPRICAFAVFCILFITGYCITLLLPGDESKIYSNIVRLHVIANSDSEEDQSQKLFIRDEILKNSKELFSKYENKEQIQENSNEIEKEIALCAKNGLKKLNSDTSVRVEIGRENYPTREYEGIRLPAGNYYSVRVKLGKAEGKNWWCVLFPPLCLGASRADSELKKTGISDDGIRVFTERNKPKYVFRFKLLEFLFGRK